MVENIKPIKKKSEVVGNDIKLGDTNSAANGGYVKFVTMPFARSRWRALCSVPIVDGSIISPTCLYGDGYEVTAL